MRRCLALGMCAVSLVGCGDDSNASSGTSETGTTTTDATADGSGTTTMPTSSTTSGTSQGTSGSTGEPPIFDVGTPGTGTDTGNVDMCTVSDDMDAIGTCDDVAPPDSFEPEIQWEWWGPATRDRSIVTPLVANLTDDNGDDAIDLCDTPDIVVITYQTDSCSGGDGRMFVLDGATGTQHWESSTVSLHACVNPALGDIDDDGLPEIVASTLTGQLIAFEHDGQIKWMGGSWQNSANAAIAMADVDNDGDVEIMLGAEIFDHDGQEIIALPGETGAASTETAADLDGDMDLEIVFGNSAYHHDGSQVYSAAGVAAGFPQVADLDDDPQPEILVTNSNGLTVIEHDGGVKYQDLRPTGDPAGSWYRPATIHDFDGDGDAEYAVSSANNYSVYERDGMLKYNATISDMSGFAAGTAFDFLGDGTAEAMYADEHDMFVYDELGASLLSIPRASYTRIEFPVVADVDNDGSAEIVVVSNIWVGDPMPPEPTVRVIADVDDRWIQARRIWNQHTYHVTNVREDGTIPQFEPPSWQNLNTFRTNAQIEGGTVCMPEPEG